ncbi:hypothetical protein [Amycolatopsis sp. NPDC051071]|uniref:hypothetical protein n=1 Tax=Amycolatopsis sp. NPDC051071 TaxID=3154637 RepID=UPI0034401FC5
MDSEAKWNSGLRTWSTPAACREGHPLDASMKTSQPDWSIGASVMWKKEWTTLIPDCLIRQPQCVIWWRVVVMKTATA